LATLCGRRNTACPFLLRAALSTVYEHTMSVSGIVADMAKHCATARTAGAPRLLPALAATLLSDAFPAIISPPW